MPRCQSAPSQRGPRPHPDWLVTELAATDTELGLRKTGKEADVFLLQRGVPVPYPVQVLGTELLMEFIGDPDGTAAASLAETRRRGADLAGLWEQLVESMCVLARLGLAHGDLSAYNLLVHREQLVLIDTPQVVEVIANPRGGEFLDRDAGNVSKWFAARDLTDIVPGTPGPDELAAVLRSEARLGPG
jgi:RIO kinase 1